MLSRTLFQLSISTTTICNTLKTTFKHELLEYFLVLLNISTLPGDPNLQGHEQGVPSSERRQPFRTDAKPYIDLGTPTSDYIEHREQYIVY